MTSNYCPGHHGHISLVAPLYNPFMIKDMYRLMKAKCFHCHRLRINATKIQAFTDALKMIKAGEIIGSQKMKAYFFSVAKEILKIESDAEDPKRIAKIQKMVNYMVGKENRAQQVTDQDVKDQMKYLYRRHNIERERFEHEIVQMLVDVVENEEPEKNQIGTSGQTSII